MRLSPARRMTTEQSEIEADNSRFRKSSFVTSNKTYIYTPQNSLKRLNSEVDLSTEYMSGSQARPTQRHHNQSDTVISNQQTLKLKKQLSLTLGLNHELAEGKEKLLHNLRTLQAEYDKIQNEHIHLLQQISEQKSKIAVLEGSSNMNEQLLEKLQKENKKFIEQINFQRIIQADMKKEMLLLKSKIDTAVIALQDHAQTKKQLLEAERLNSLMVAKLQKMDSGLKAVRKEISDTQKLSSKEKLSELLSYIEQLKSDNKKIKQHSEKVIKELNEKYVAVEKKYRGNGFRENQYQKIISQQEGKIKMMTEQMTELVKKNNRLVTELDENRRYGRSTIGGSVSVHTNSSYLTKIIRENHLEMEQIKREVDTRDEEINRLRNELSITMHTLKGKNDEIQAIQEMVSYEKRANEKKKEAEIFDLKQKNTSLLRRIDQMSQSHHELRNELKEKDRIILNYVNSKKNDV